MKTLIVEVPWVMTINLMFSEISQLTIGSLEFKMRESPVVVTRMTNPRVVP